MMELGYVLLLGGLLLFLIRFEILAAKVEKLEDYVELQVTGDVIDAEFEDEETRG